MTDLRAFCMPKWGIEMTEGTLAEWMVGEGDAFKKGDLLCLIETDKITNEVEAEKDGVVERIVVKAGGDAEAVGSLLAVFGDGSADAEAIDSFVAGFKPTSALGSVRKKKPAAQKVADDQPVPPKDASGGEKKPVKIDTNRPISPEALKFAEAEGVDISGIEGSGREGRITLQDVQQAARPARTPQLRGPVDHPEENLEVFASPLARRIASQNGVDLAPVEGTGPRGRIRKADVLKLLEGQGTASDAPFVPVDNRPDIEPFDRVRKVVAKRLTAAKQDIPHFYLRTSVCADPVIALRRHANLVLGSKASLNDFVVMAAARALRRHPEVNVQLHGEEIHRFPHADVSVAVASPNGLMTPIVRQADRLGIGQIAKATRALIDKAEAGRLGYDDLDGGTFTVSNLGMFGIENFDAIINPPQAAILAVGTASCVPTEGENGAIAFETRISLTLSVDHRAIDGAAGAKFLATFKTLFENPEELFA
ncbi:2-oxo acid dehydrogenase subunit E2 [Citromicrobium bathyomarinum]